MIKWIKTNLVPSILIILLFIVGLVFGIWQGSTYLQEEIRYFDLEPAGGYVERTVTEGIVYHHTASGDVPISNHHQFHLSRGWVAVGYHFQIRQDGTIEEGRPHNVRGAHAPSANATHIGIAFSGNMQNKPPTSAQYESAAKLHVWLEDQYSKELTITGHENWSNTSCPGKYTDLNKLGNMVEKLRVKDKPSDLEYSGILINSFADFPNVEPLATRLDAPIYLRNMGIEFDKVIIAGGGAKDVNAKKVIDLSGNDRYETAENVNKFIEQEISEIEFNIEKINKGIVINSFADFPNVEPLATRLNAPIFLRSVDIDFEKAIIAGGGIDGVDAEVYIDLSGSDRYQTSNNIYDYLN